MGNVMNHFLLGLLLSLQFLLKRDKLSGQIANLIFSVNVQRCLLTLPHLVNVGTDLLKRRDDRQCPEEDENKQYGNHY